MCLLTYYPPDVQPEPDALRRGAINNQDGYGFAIVDRERQEIICRRSMTATALISEFVETRAVHSDGPALFHCRIGTAGAESKSNCHPFAVGGDPRTVVAHNGIMPLEVQPRKGDTRCDTRIFAEQHLPYRNWRSRKGMRKLEQWLRTDKAVILSVHPAFSQDAWLVNEHQGHWLGDVWYSNHSYTSNYGYGYGYGYGNGTMRHPTTGSLYRRYPTPDNDCWSTVWGYHRYHESWCGLSHVRTEPGKLRQAEDTNGYGWCPGVDTEAQHRSESAQVAVAAVESLAPDDDGLATRLTDPCLMCGLTHTISVVTYVCTACGTCQDCEFHVAECMCYVPAQLDRESLTDADIDRWLTGGGETEE